MPLELIAEPDTQELASTTVDTSTERAPLSVPLGKALDFESALKSNISNFKANQTKKETEAKVESPKDEPKPEKEQPATEKPAEGAADKPVEGKTDPNYGKAKVQYSKLPPDQREYLLASEERRLAKLTEAEERAKKAEETAAAHEARIKELEEIANTAPKERDEIKGKYEKLNETYAEQQKRLASIDVTKTDEYMAKVSTPFNEEVTEPLKEFASRFEEGTFNVQFAYDALRSGDLAALAQVRNSIKDQGDRDDFREMEIKAKQLVKLHGQYVADAPKAYQEITERKTAAEKQAIEAHRGEVNKSLEQVRKANAGRFPFLDVAAKDTPPELKAQLQKADEQIQSFDFASLKPQEQASFIEAAHKGFIAANFIDGYAAHVTAEKQKADARVTELETKIADLEKRLGSKESVTLTPGRTGNEPRGAQAAAQATSALGMFEAAKQAALRK